MKNILSIPLGSILRGLIVPTQIARLTQLFFLLVAMGSTATGAPGLLGVYYDNMDFTVPRLARTEAVNFDWGLEAPAPSVGAETFSVRWTGKVVARCTDLYQIFTVSDDGV